MFNGVIDAVIFVAALDSFDEPVEEAPEKNMLEDSLELFDEVLSMSGGIGGLPLVLVLNKVSISPTHTAHTQLARAARDPNAVLVVPVRRSTASSASFTGSRSGGSGTRGSSRSRGCR